MSYIYEALKRAEDERARGAVASRPIRRAVLAAKRRWWLWILIGVLGANAVGLVALVLVRGTNSRVVTTASTTSTESRARGAMPVTSGPVSQDAESARVTPATPPATPGAITTALPSSAPAARTVASAPRIPPAAPPPRVTGRPVTPPPPAPARVEPPRATTPAVVARDGAEPRPAPAPAPEATAKASPGGPVVAPPASSSARDETPPATVETPKLQVQVVVYSDVPAQRMVFIDGRRFSEGDKVDADTVVERITPEGAIVTHRGQRFALTSGRP